MSSLSGIRSSAIAFASAIALLFASTFAAADGVDSDQDGVRDDLEDATERTVVVPPARWGDSFSVSSHLGMGDVRDQFNFWYGAGQFGLWYWVMDGASIAYNVEARNLLVWQDDDGDRRMDDAEISRVIPLGPDAFEGVEVTRTERTDADGGTVYNFMVENLDRTVSFNVTVAQRFTRLNDITLTPMEARVEVLLRPILTDPTASVAIEFLVETGPEDVVTFENRSWDEERRFAPGEHSMNVTGSDGSQSASAFFSWADDAVVSGQTASVAYAARDVDSKRYNLTLAYSGSAPQGPIVVHKMAFGIRSVAYDSIERMVPVPPPLQPDLFLFTATFAGVAGLVATTVYLSNRRRVRHEDEGRKP